MRAVFVQGEDAFLFTQRVGGCVIHAIHSLARDNQPLAVLESLGDEPILWAGRDEDRITVITMRQLRQPSPHERKAFLEVVHLGRSGEVVGSEEIVFDATSWPSRLWPGVADFAEGRFLLAQRRDDPLGYSRFYVYDLETGSWVGQPTRAWLAFFLERDVAKHVGAILSKIARKGYFRG